MIRPSVAGTMSFMAYSEREHVKRSAIQRLDASLNKSNNFFNNLLVTTSTFVC